MSAEPIAVDRDALSAWVTRHASAKTPAIMFGLNHAPEVDVLRTSPITQREFPKFKTTEERDREAREVVDEFVREAETWASTMPRAQRFTVTAHRSTDPSEHQGVMAVTAFVVHPREELLPRGEVSPNDMVGTLQRLLSDMVRSLGSNMQACMDRISEDNGHIRQEYRRLADQQMKILMERETLVSQKADREVRAEVERVKIGAAKEGVALLLSLVKKHANVEGQRPAAAPAELVQLFMSVPAAERPLLLRMLQPVTDAMSPEAREEMRRLCAAAMASANGAAQLARAGEEGAT